MSNKNQGSPCPSCKKPATGNFCQHCGGALGGRFCNQCGGKVAANATFCNQCGSNVGEGGGGSGTRRDAATAALGGSNLPWWIAGGAMFVVIFFTAMSMVRPAGPAVPAGGAPTTVNPATQMGTTDISQMTPLEAADRLFDRIMRSLSAGDTASAVQFAPMAISSYERARPLSLDATFHLSMVNRAAGDLEAALAAALEILEQHPTHLLGLAAAGEAAHELGRGDEAVGYYQSLVDVYDDEMAAPLQEYMDHSGIVGTLKQDAEAFLAGR